MQTANEVDWSACNGVGKLLINGDDVQIIVRKNNSVLKVIRTLPVNFEFVLA